MKTFLIITSLLLLSFSCEARDWYRIYLVSQIHSSVKISSHSNSFSATPISCVIPRFERPKGAVFYRMEDYLTAKTKVWIKIGVK